MLHEADIEDLERSIVESVAPARIVEIGDWLVPLDDGAIGRAKSAVPLSHFADPAAIPAVEAAYVEANLPPAFRVAETAELGPVREALVRRGFAPHTPTIMKLGTAQGLRALSDDPAELFARPDADWAACFAGQGFDPEEAAARVRNLTRSRDALFAAVREGGQVAAVGVVTFARGWAGVHGMRTAPAARRKGYARRILAALGRAAAARGIERIVLQVTEENPARILYRAGGFTRAWRYHYWGKV
ncbi:MAG: GNAT family N-acetyltransferase [Alphaproteobacteria bacterium]|nr:GNAT family N-acetyltransferase [Alphaproteobacteria bacterium]